MLIEVDAIIQSMATTLPAAISSATFGFDATDVRSDDIKALVDQAKAHLGNNGWRLKGVRVGGDVFARLGGADLGWLNAQFRDQVPIVAFDVSGRVEFVFER